MKSELEAKFYPVDILSLQTKLKSVSAKLISPERLMRRIIYDRKYNPHFICGFVRIRDEGGKVTLTAKTHTETGKMANELELETEISDFETTNKIFTQMGLKSNQYIETKRESWLLDGCHLDIDTWPGLEPYLEIEGDSEAVIKSVAEKLGFSWDNHFISNSMDMYANLYELPIKEIIQMTETLTFKDNPFANLSPTGKIHQSVIR